jgi:hypothetical protein
MFDSITHFMAPKSEKQISRSELTTALRPAPKPAAAWAGNQSGFSKIFRWSVPPEETPQPTTVEVVGSFTDWRKVPLAYDKPTKTWTMTLTNIQGNHTHRYVIIVDGKPSYDKTCDGLTAPQSPQEEQWQIQTPRGPRVMLMFAQTK